MHYHIIETLQILEEGISYMSYKIEYIIRELDDGSFTLYIEPYTITRTQKLSLSARDFRELLVKFIVVRFPDYSERDIRDWLPPFVEDKPA